MKKIKFNPKTNIEQYLNTGWNTYLYKELIKCNKQRQNWIKPKPILFEPLDFFNLLYKEFEIAKANKDKPLTVAKHLTSLKSLKNHNWYFFATYFNALIRIHSKHDNQLKICNEFISDAIKEKGNEIIKKRKIKPGKIERLWDFERIKYHIGILPDTNSKLAHLIEKLTDYKQNAVEFGFKKTSYEQQIKFEIKKLKALEEIKKDITGRHATTELVKDSNGVGSSKKKRKLVSDYVIIAYKYIVMGKIIEKSEVNKIALANNLKDGDTLYQKYRKLIRDGDITAKDKLPKMRYKQSLINCVIPFLDKEDLKKQQEEKLKNLKKNIEEVTDYQA